MPGHHSSHQTLGQQSPVAGPTQQHSPEEVLPALQSPSPGEGRLHQDQSREPVTRSQTTEDRDEGQGRGTTPCSQEKGHYRAVIGRKWLVRHMGGSW